MLPSQPAGCAPIAEGEVSIYIARRGHAKDVLDLRMLRFARSRAQDIVMVIMAIG